MKQRSGVTNYLMGLAIACFFFVVLSEIIEGGEYSDIVDEKVLEELEKSEEVRIIVVMEERTEVVGEETGGGGFETIRRRSFDSGNRLSSKKEISCVLYGLNENDLRDRREYSIIDGFSGRVTKDGLNKLRMGVGVKKIYFDYPVKAMLQDSVPLINASVVHSVMVGGVNITGIGQTICVVDTGVDYTHADLGGCFGDGCKVIAGYDFINNDADPLDDNGHGTHVAGIAAASGGITGVASGANIVAVKVLDSLGDGYLSGINRGIEWCIGNATKYNISVISLSLGTSSLYESYCDDTYGPTALLINEAISKNISVVASTGNDGSSTHIVSPACIENVTSVGASGKGDLVWSGSNRNNLTDLFAPGVGINSTGAGGGYISMTGTSMATPHVAGVIALLQDYKWRESGVEVFCAEIENSLKEHGKIIFDNTTSLNFPRVDVYPALVSLDSVSPEVYLYEPQNRTYSENISISLNYSAFDTFLDSVWYSLDFELNVSLYDNTTLNLSREFHTVLVYANDSNGNENFSAVYFNIEPEIPVVNLNWPVNFYNTSDVNLTFNCSATDNSELLNISFYVGGDDVLALNQTRNISGKSNSSSFVVENLGDGNYLWNCLVYDNNSNSGWGDFNHSFMMDTEYPVVSLISPSDSFSWTSSNEVVFMYNVSELAVSNCSLIVNEEVNSTDNSVLSGRYNQFNVVLSNGGYNWSVNCSDYVGHINGSEVRELSVGYTAPVSSPPSSSSSGGSGGGGGGSSRRSSPAVVNTTALGEFKVTKAVSEEVVPETESGISDSSEKTEKEKNVDFERNYSLKEFIDVILGFFSSVGRFFRLLLALV